MRIVTLSPFWKEELAPLLAPGLSLTIVNPDDAAARDAALADAEILISADFTAAMAGACRRLRLLVCPAAGTDSVDRAALPDGVLLVKGTGHQIPMAEYIIGSLVGLRQRFLSADAALRLGEWSTGFHAANATSGFLTADGTVEELSGSNLGFVGFGRIAQEAARRAGAFGMRVAAVTLHPEKPRDGVNELEFLGRLADAADVDKLVAWSDALVLCCELSPLTRGLMDARRFALMKRTALLVNVARGLVAVEQDLYDALASRRIAGAALDVWYRYPGEAGQAQLPADLPFHKLDNVIMTPHASAWTQATRRRRLEGIATAINDFARNGA